jgi:hypothetical protein
MLSRQNRQCQARARRAESLAVLGSNFVWSLYQFNSLIQGCCTEHGASLLLTWPSLKGLFSFSF